MEILPCEEVEHDTGAKIQLQQGGDTCTQQSEYYKTIISTCHSFSDDSSDGDDYKAPLGITSEESSMCCVCGDSIPFLGNMIEHFKTHTVEVHCHLCRAKFGRVILLALHLKNAHSKRNLLCEICGSVFSCTWHLNGHLGKHQKDEMEVKPVVKLEEKDEISIQETINCIDLKTTILSDHSYCVSAQVATNDTCSDIQKRIDNDANLLIKTGRSPHIKHEPIDAFGFSSFPFSQSEPEHLSFGLKEENDHENELGETVVCKVAAEEEIGLTEDDESNPDSLPPGDTAYNPDENLSSDSNDSDSKCVSYRRHRKTKRMKQQVPNRKRSAKLNLGSINIAEKFGFQSDSPFCCYGKFANLEKHMDDCSNKLLFPCCLCSVACKDEELLLKHMIEKHPAAGFICAYCHNVFPRLDNFKNHICGKRPTGDMNLPATSVSHLPIVPLSNSSGQGRPSAPMLKANQNTIKMIKITQTANKVSPAPDPPMVANLGSTKVLTLQHLQTTPLGTAKVTDLVPQVVAMPQTLVRPNFLPSSCIARSKVHVQMPSVVRPSLSNPARKILRIPTPSNPPLQTPVIVSFSPTVNISVPTFASANKPVLRQTSVSNIRPLPVNVRPINSVTFPSLVSALTGNSHPQVPLGQVQAPLQVVAMFMNQSRNLSLQKQLKQSWRSKTIFPCRHCGAVSRQPSLRVRHRYLHRGSRLYRCQCGRSFQQQLHLLRHQVQHADSVRFVCAQCGNTFEGAHKLTWHRHKHKKGREAKKKCKAAFDCSCGQMFARPSAMLWHMLRNSKLSKRTRKHLQSVSL